MLFFWPYTLLRLCTLSPCLGSADPQILRSGESDPEPRLKMSKITTENPFRKLHAPQVAFSIFLLALTLVIYWPVLSHEFVNIDDNLYVTENRHVQGGLTWSGASRAFTSTTANNWHPLTMLSHMLDCHLYGLNPRGHHLSNLLLHTANTLFLCLALCRMTGCVWRSAFVAAAFSLHPTHVESVAWIAERKDVLSTFFWILTMWSYAHYVSRPGITRYLLVLLLFVLGLLSKPMVVTLPFVLLLMDYWPLERLQRNMGEGSDTPSPLKTFKSDKASPSYLVREKLPFFALSTIFSIVAFFAQQEGGSVESLDALPLKIRFANTLVAYVQYIGKMIWPHELAVYYPHPGSALPLWQAAASGLFLALVTVLALRTARRLPYLPVGWFWYLGTLVPVVGLVQVGGQSMADRYTYIPFIGLFVVVAWGVPSLLGRRPYRGPLLSFLSGAALFSCLVGTWIQVGYWHDSITLFEHTISVTADNAFAHVNLGSALVGKGKTQEAIKHFSEALRVKPHDARARHNLGFALMKQGNLEKAIMHYRMALQIKRDYAEARSNLGIALGQQGKLAEAISHLSEALRMEPDHVEAHYNLGLAFYHQGELDNAVGHYREAITLKPEYAEAHNNLGIALAIQGKPDKAIGHFSEAVRINPNFREAENNLKRALSQGATPNIP